MTEFVLFTVGIVVGVMNSIAGGGMLLGFPVMLAMGMPALIANATANIVVLPGQISSAYGYRKYLAKTPRRYLLLAIPCLVGAVIGALILRYTTASSFDRLVPFLITAAVVLFAFQPFLHRHLHLHLHGPVKHRRKVRPLIIIGLATIPLSIYGGYFGAGFGFVMLALLGFTKLQEIHQMNALKNVMAVFIAGASTVCLLGTGLIDWRLGLPMAFGNLIGGYAGSMGAQRIPSHAVRIIVIIIGFCTAGYLMIHAY